MEIFYLFFRFGEIFSALSLVLRLYAKRHLVAIKQNLPDQGVYLFIYLLVLKVVFYTGPNIYTLDVKYNP